MRLYIFIAVCFFLATINAHSQGTFFANSSGNWNDVTIWDTPNPGDGNPSNLIPGATDFVVTFGYTVGINGNYECAILLVQFDTQSIIWQQNGFFANPYTLTVNDYLGSVDGVGSPTAPTVSVIEDNTRLTISLTGTASNSLSGDVLSAWNATAPFRNLTIAPGGGNSSFISDNFAITSGGSLNVTNGTFDIQGQLSDVTANSNVNVSSGATLTVGGAINGGAASSNFSTITNDGTINVGTAGYVNTTNFNINANSTLNVSNNQPNGWWHSTSPGPSSVSVDVTSTINYNRIGAQGIYSGSYGNLSMTGGSGTKTLNNTGALSVLGSLTIGGSNTFDTSSNTNTINLSGNVTNDGTWSPTQQVNFNGAASQSITGNNVISFGGGVRVSNTAGTIQLVGVNGDINGTFTLDAGATFNPNGNTVNLSGNLSISGNLTASGTFVFDGSTTVSGSGTAAFNNVTISGTLSAQGQSATIAGSFTNNGTFDNLNGTVDFNGTINQTISGSATTNFYNLTISNSSATVANNGTVNLNTAMTLASNATFDADGSGSGVFTIRSTSGSNTARVNALPSGASITGNVVSQRYFDGAGDVWRNFGVNVSGATLTDITNAGFTFNGTGNDMAYYDETVTGVVDNGWVLRSAFPNSNLAANFGYSMWTRAAETPRVVSFTGTLNQGTQNIPISYTNTGSPADDGWNLVNNPLPATVDWDNMTKANLNTAVSVWNTSTSAYDTWNGSTGGLSNGLIASGQAFWVQASAASPTLSIPESAKSTSSSSFLKTSAEPVTNQLIVSLIQEDKKDKLYIHFRDDATDNFDGYADARKLKNGIFNLSSLSADGQNLAINSLPLQTCSKSVNLKIEDAPAGNYTLLIEDLVSFTTSVDVVLKDAFTSTTSPISEGSIYDFQITSDPNSYGENRFTIEITTQPVIDNVQYSHTNQCDVAQSVTITNAQLGATYHLIQNNDTIASGTATEPNLVINFTEGQIAQGTNVFDVAINVGTCGDTLLTSAITIYSVPLLEVSNVTDGKSCGPGQVSIKAEGATGNAYYNWYESLEDTTPIAGQNGNELLTPELTTTRFYYVAIVNEAGCESATRTKVTAEIVNLDIPEIRIQGNEISTSAVADNYIWYKDGEVIDGESNAAISISTSGSYNVVIQSNDCEAASEPIVATILGVEELKKAGISVYPNPVATTLHIKGDTQNIQSILLYDTKGVEVFRADEHIPDEINMNSLKKGIYIINIVTPNQTITSRVRKK